MADSTDYSYISHHQRSFNNDTWRGYRPYFIDGEKVLEEEKERMKELINKLEQKNEENFNLRLRIQEIEKVKENLLFDLEQVENEYNLTSRRFSNRENDLIDKVKFLEAEKGNLENRLNYYLRDKLDDDYLFQENRRLGRANLDLEIKLEILTHFFNRIQNSLMSRSSKNKPFVLLENLDISTLRQRLGQMEDEIQNVVETKNNLQNRDANKSLVIGNSDIINKKIKELSEENDNISIHLDEAKSADGKPGKSGDGKSANKIKSKRDNADLTDIDEESTQKPGKIEKSAKNGKSSKQKNAKNGDTNKNANNNANPNNSNNVSNIFKRTTSKKPSNALDISIKQELIDSVNKLANKVGSLDGTIQCYKKDPTLMQIKPSQISNDNSIFLEKDSKFIRSGGKKISTIKGRK